MNLVQTNEGIRPWKPLAGPEIYGTGARSTAGDSMRVRPSNDKKRSLGSAPAPNKHTIRLEKCGYLCGYFGCASGEMLFVIRSIEVLRGDRRGYQTPVPAQMRRRFDHHGTGEFKICRLRRD
jgi:hypothetical protein